MTCSACLVLFRHHQQPRCWRSDSRAVPTPLNELSTLRTLRIIAQWCIVLSVLPTKCSRLPGFETPCSALADSDWFRPIYNPSTTFRTRHLLIQSQGRQMILILKKLPNFVKILESYFTINKSSNDGSRYSRMARITNNHFR